MFLSYNHHNIIILLSQRNVLIHNSIEFSYQHIETKVMKLKKGCKSISHDELIQQLIMAPLTKQYIIVVSILIVFV